MTRRGLILAGIVLVILAVVGVFALTPKGVPEFNPSLIGNRLNGAPGRPHAHGQHYPITKNIDIPDDPPPPGFKYVADGRLSSTIAATDFNARWPTPGVIPLRLKRSIKTFLVRAVLDEVDAQHLHAAGIASYDSYQPFGLPSVTDRVMGRQNVALKVDSNAEYIQLPPGIAPLDKNVLDIRITGAGIAEVLVRSDLIKAAPKKAKAQPTRASSGISRMIFAPPTYLASLQSPDPNAVLSSIDIAADELVRQCVANNHALRQPRPVTTPLLNSAPQDAPPGVFVQYQGFQFFSTSMDSRAAFPPVDPDWYAARVARSIQSCFDADHKQFQAQLDGRAAQISEGVSPVGQTAPEMPTVSDVSLSFAKMKDVVLHIPNQCLAQFPNGAALLRAQQAALLRASESVREAAIRLNRMAARSPQGAS